MDVRRYMKTEGEQPLDNVVESGGLCSILRTVACIGDSLSSGELESFMDGKQGYHDFYDISWGQFLARDAGCTVYNFSKGGMTAKDYCEHFAQERGFYNEELKALAYIIALGVNDLTRVSRGELEFGSIEDVDPEHPENNKPTFAGYYGRIISEYKRIQPKGRFFLVTVPRTVLHLNHAELFDSHAELLYQIAELFEYCYVIDLRKYGPLHDEEFIRNFYLARHMNAAGYRLFALMIESYIDYIIRQYPEDFAQIGFVGTPFYNEKFKW